MSLILNRSVLVSEDSLVSPVKQFCQASLAKTILLSYFFDFFGENIDLCDTDFIEDAKKVPPPVEITNYERIHKYVLKHPRPVTEEQTTTEEEAHE